MVGAAVTALALGMTLSEPGPAEPIGEVREVVPQRGVVARLASVGDCMVVVIGDEKASKCGQQGVETVDVAGLKVQMTVAERFDRLDESCSTQYVFLLHEGLEGSWCFKAGS